VYIYIHIDTPETVISEYNLHIKSYLIDRE
jgi:hypothetical protein